MAEGRDFFMAIILLNELKMPDLDKIATCVENCSIVQGAVDAENRESIIIFNEKLYSILFNINPYPELAYKSIGISTTFWPDAMKSLKHHKAHIVVCSRANDKTLVDQLIEHTVITSLVAADMPVCGIIWGTSALTNMEQFQYYCSRMVKLNSLPIPVWVQIQFSLDKNGGVIVSTNGMGDYGLMEVECNISPLPLENTLNIVENFISYIINYGPIVMDGNTIGVDSKYHDKSITVRIRDSFRPNMGMVYLLDFS